jgi:RHS repeat-associated protein
LVSQLTTPAPDGFNSQGSEVTSYQYDGIGRLTQETLPDGKTETWSYNTLSSYNTFFDAPLSFTDENGKTTTYTINQNGDIYYVQDPLNRTTQYFYGSYGLLSGVSQPDPNGGFDYITYTYGSINPGSGVRADLLTGIYYSDNTSETFTYDGADRVITDTNRLGFTETYSYDDFDRVLKVTQPQPVGPYDVSEAPYTVYAYDSSGELLSETGAYPKGTVSPANGPQQPVTNYMYDPFGRLITVTGPDVNQGMSGTAPSRPITRYTYDPSGNLTSEVDPLGHVDSNYYDLDGRLATSVDSAGNATQYAHDYLGRLVATTDPMGRTTEFSYNVRNELVKEVDPLGNADSYTYDPNGNLASQTDAMGRVTTYQHNFDNELTTITEPAGADSKLPAPVITYNYDTLGRVASILQPAPSSTTQSPTFNETDYGYSGPTQHIVTVQYPAPGATITTQYNALGQIVSETDPSVSLMPNGQPLPNQTTYQYDTLGRLIQVTSPAPNQGAASPVSLYGYDNLGNLTTDAETDTTRIAAAQAPLSQSTYVYDGLSDLTTETDFTGTVKHSYDLGGRLLSTVDQRSQLTSDQPNHTTSYVYDTLGNLVQVSAPSPDGTAQAPTSKFVYDANGNPIFSTDPTGATSISDYDPLGREVFSTDANGATTHTNYGAVGNVVRVVDPLGNWTAYSYDNLDQLIQERVSFSTIASTYQYDAAGDLTQSVDRDGHTIQYTYDNLGRQTAENWVSGSSTIKSIAYQYDANGNLLSASDNTAASALGVSNQAISDTFSYDGDGRVATAAANFNGNSLTLTSGYDSLGNRTSLTESLGSQTQTTASTTYNFDGASRMTGASMMIGSGQTAVQGPQVTLSYDGASNLTQITRKVATNGPTITSNLAYNNDNQVTSIAHLGGSTPLASYGYTLDAAGRVTHETETNATGGYETHNFTYDPTGQLKSESIGTGASTNYNYDANGNRTGGGKVVSPGNELTNDGTYTYQYDQQGNETKRTNNATGAIRNYIYDFENRLAEVLDTTASGTQTQDVKYIYDPLGRRVAMSTSGAVGSQATTTWTVYDGDNPYADYNSNAATAPTSRYLYGPAVDMILARDDAGSNTVTWYLSDALGSVRTLAQIVGSAVNVIDRIDYDAYGNITAESALTAGDRFKYTGGQFDSATGLYYDRARYYNPLTGTFLGPDPAGFAAGDPNLNRYTGNDPTNYTDPSGFARQDRGSAGVESGMQNLLYMDGSVTGPALTTGPFMGGIDAADAFVSAGDTTSGDDQDEENWGFYAPPKRRYQGGGYNPVNWSALGFNPVRFFADLGFAIAEAGTIIGNAGTTVTQNLATSNQQGQAQTIAANNAANAGHNDPVFEAYKQKNLNQDTAKLIATTETAVAGQYEAAFGMAGPSGPARAGNVPRAQAALESGRGNAPLLPPTPRPSLTEVPSVRGGAFQKWFNELTPAELKQVWSDPKLRASVEARLRSPGGFHEWLPVSRATKFKEWGISAEQIREWRTATSNVRFKPSGQHGGELSTTAHNEILRIAESALDFASYKMALQQWAEQRLVGGSAALPPGLRP